MRKKIRISFSFFFLTWRNVEEKYLFPCSVPGVVFAGLCTLINHYRRFMGTGTGVGGYFGGVVVLSSFWAESRNTIFIELFLSQFKKVHWPDAKVEPFPLSPLIQWSSHIFCSENWTVLHLVQNQKKNRKEYQMAFDF